MRQRPRRYYVSCTLATFEKVAKLAKEWKATQGQVLAYLIESGGKMPVARKRQPIPVVRTSEPDVDDDLPF